MVFTPQVQICSSLRFGIPHTISSGIKGFFLKANKITKTPQCKILSLEIMHTGEYSQVKGHGNDTILCYLKVCLCKYIHFLLKVYILKVLLDLIKIIEIKKLLDGR